MAAAPVNLLQGNIRSQLITLTLPLFLGEILQQLYNTTDSLIIGRFLGTDAFAASGISGSIMNLFIFVLSGFCVGVSVLFSGCYGAGDLPKFRRTNFTAATAGTAFTLLLSLLCILLTGPILRLVATPDSLFAYCRSYLVIVLAGLIATYFYNLFSGILRSVGATGASLLFLAAALASNIVLDIVMVGFLPLGIAGAALATVIAQSCSAFACYLYLRRRFPHLMFTRADCGLHTGILKQIFSYGTASALHQSSLYIGKLLVQGIVNSCGTAVIAAFTATTRIEAFINAPGNAFSQASSIMISQNRGAGNRQRTVSAIKESFRLILFSAVVLSVIMYFVSPYALRLFLDASETESLTAGTAYLKLIFFFYVLSYTGYCFVGISKGMGRMTAPVIGTTVQISVRVLVSALLIHGLGLSGVAWATGIGWVFVVAFHLWRFLTWYPKEFGGKSSECNE